MGEEGRFNEASGPDGWFSNEQEHHQFLFQETGDGNPHHMRTRGHPVSIGSMNKQPRPIAKPTFLLGIKAASKGPPPIPLDVSAQVFPQSTHHLSLANQMRCRGTGVGNKGTRGAVFIGLS